MAKGRLPFYWGNNYWGIRPSGVLYPKGIVRQSNPKWTDYKKLPGGSTEHLYAPGHPQKTFRDDFQGQIIDQIIRDSRASRNDHPACVITCGGTASGKTSAMDFFVKEILQESQNEKYVRIDFDRVKQRLPEFIHMKERRIKEAAMYTQTESAKITGKLLKKSIRIGANIIYETTLQTPAMVEERVSDLRKKKYFIYLIATHVTETVGQERAIKRHLNGGRWVPPEAISETYRACPASLRQLAPQVDFLLLLDNNGTKNFPMFKREAAGGIEILDTDAYSRYLAEVSQANNLAI